MTVAGLQTKELQKPFRTARSTEVKGILFDDALPIET